MKVLKKHGILYKSDVSPNLHILYTRVLHCNKCLCERKSWRMHGCWCTRKLVIKVQCKECGHSRMGTISLYPCQGTCYKEAALVTDSSATPTGTQFVWWSPPSPSSSSPAAAEVLGCATHCVVMIPTHSGTGLALVISTISKLPQWTDYRDSRSAEGSEFGRLRIFVSLDPSSPHHIPCPEFQFLWIVPSKDLWIYHPWSSLPRRHGCPETFPVVPSSILPESLHLPPAAAGGAQTSIFMQLTFIRAHKSNSFLIWNRIVFIHQLNVQSGCIISWRDFLCEVHHSL